MGSRTDSLWFNLGDVCVFSVTLGEGNKAVWSQNIGQPAWASSSSDALSFESSRSPVLMIWSWRTGNEALRSSIVQSSSRSGCSMACSVEFTDGFIREDLVSLSAWSVRMRVSLWVYSARTPLATCRGRLECRELVGGGSHHKMLLSGQ